MFENINIECVTVFKVCAACQTPCAASQRSTYVVRLYSDFMTLSTDYNYYVIFTPDDLWYRRIHICILVPKAN